MRPLSFCHVTTFYPPYNFGGDGIGIQRLARALVRRGHRCTVVHDADAYRFLKKGPPPASDVEDDGVEVVRLESGFRTLSPLLVQQFGTPVLQRARLRKLFDERRFDVIQYHNVSLVGGPGVLAMGRAIKLYMAHEHWLVCPTHVLWRHGRELCTGRECLRCVLNHGRPPQLWRSGDALQRAVRHVDMFIAMSDFSREKHREFGFLREMEVLPYFLPDPEPGSTSPAESPPAGERPHARPYFLFVGRLERIKGLDEVIPLFAHSPEADLVIVGDGEHAAHLRELALGLDNVRFAGRVSSEELARFYRHAIALVVPSICYETFGIILIEAFRAGTPVIARRIGPFPEIIERAGSGFTFETEGELLAAMTALQSDATLRERHARAGYDAFVRHWSESAVIPRYLDLIRRIAERRGRRDIVEALGPSPAAPRMQPV